MLCQVRDEFQSLVETTSRLRDEWPAVRDAVLREAGKLVARTHSSDLSALLQKAEDDVFDEGCSNDV